MMFFMSLIPASILAAVGYIVLFASGRSEGTLRTVGKVLGIWLFVLALLPLAGGAYMAATGGCPMMRGHNSGDMTSKMPGDMMGDMMTPKADAE